MNDMEATRDERPWALVSGASGGLGQAFSRHLASCGVNLVVTGRRHDVLDDLADQLTTRYGIKTIVHPCDISSASERLALVNEIAGRGIIIDTLVNNAGFGAAGRIAETDPERQTSQVEVNCEAVVHLCGLLLPGMITAKRGSIINVASTAAFQPIPQFATYAASKSSCCPSAVPYGLRPMAPGCAPPRSALVPPKPGSSTSPGYRVWRPVLGATQTTWSVPPSTL